MLMADLNGNPLTEKQKNLLKNVKSDSRVQQTVKDVVNNANSTMSQRNRNMDDFVYGVAISNAIKSQMKSGENGEKNGVSVSETESTYDVSADGKTVLKSTGEDVSIREVTSVKDGKMTLRLEDGREVSSEDVSYASRDEALVYETVANMGVNASEANVLVNAFHTGNVDADTYTLGIQEAYRYGKYNYSVQFYESGNNDERLKIVNSMDNLKFSEREDSDPSGIDTDSNLNYHKENANWQEVNGNERREESRESFYRRAHEKKYTVRERGQIAYGYASVANKTRSAGQTEWNLKKLGIQVIVHDGLEVNANGITSVILGDATSVAGDVVYVRNSMKTDPMETAGHEAFHFWKHTDARIEYEETVAQNIVFSSDSFIQFQKEIADAYFGEEIGIEDDAVDKLTEEIFAYITGLVHAGDSNSIVRSFMRDYDAVKAAWGDLIKKQATSGDGQTRYSTQETDNIGTFDGSHPDIRYSFSNQTDSGDIAPLPGWVYGRDIELEDIGPVSEAARRNAISDGEIGPVRTDIDALTKEKPSRGRVKNDRLSESYNERMEMAGFGPEQANAAARNASVAEYIGKSVGAKAKNYKVYNPVTGENMPLTEGTRITQPKNHVIAGKGRDRQIDQLQFLLDKYGGEPLEWTKEKGFGFVDDEFGESHYVELHWYQEPTVGKVRMKIKVQSDGRIYIEED